MSLLSGKVFEAIANGSVSLLHLADDVKNSIAAKLPLSGGTLTGALTLSGDGTNNLHAVTKQQLDAVASQASWELIETRTSISGNSVEDFTDLSDYSEIMVLAHRVTRSTSSNVAVRVSDDNGLTWMTSGYYRPGGDITESLIQITFSATTDERSGNLHLPRFNSTDEFKPCFAPPLNATFGNVTSIENANPLNAIQVISSNGTFTGGKISVYGKK